MIEKEFRNSEGRRMLSNELVPASIEKMAEWVKTELPTSSEYDIALLSIRAAREQGLRRTDREAAVLGKQILKQILTSFAEEVAANDTVPDIDRNDFIEQLLREIGVHRETDIAKYTESINEIIAADKRPVIERRIRPVRRYNREELAALRAAKARGGDPRDSNAA